MTKRDVSNDEIMTALSGFANDVNKRFDDLEDRFDKRFFTLEHKMAKIEADIIDLKKSQDHLTNTVDAFIARIDRYETEQLVRDRQFERLLEWARKVSEKTGIPLENF